VIATGLGGSGSGKGAVKCPKITAKPMAGFARKPTRGDGYSKRKAKECLKHDWRFKQRAPEAVADAWRDSSFANWEEVLRRKQRSGLVLTREELFKPYEEFVYETSEDEGKKEQLFSGGYWGVYILEKGQLSKRSTLDWGVSIKVGEFGPMTGAGLIRKVVTESLGEDAYEEFKTVLMDDLASLKECMNKGSVWLEEHDSLGVSFVCSESSERLLRRLGMRLERGWAFWFPHYSFE
jgi:hypothetical protein